jgi:hypothetical protein
MVFEMRQQAFQMIDSECTPHTLQRLIRTLHDVLDEQLAAPGKQVCESHAALR